MISMNGWEVISVYTRRQAIEDGALIDASELAREAGFRLPVALTQGAWAECVAFPEKLKAAGQSETGRLWDVLWVASRAALRGAGGDRVSFRVAVARLGERHEEVELVAHIGPGDTAEPVITIMLPGED